MLRLFAYSPELASRTRLRPECHALVGVATFHRRSIWPAFSMDRSECQAVAISRTAATRPAIVERLLAAGKHLLLVDLPGWQSERNGSTAAIGRKDQRAGWKCVNPSRYQPSRRLIRQQIADHLGPPGLLRSYRWEPDAADSRPTAAGCPRGCPTISTWPMAVRPAG